MKPEDAIRKVEKAIILVRQARGEMKEVMISYFKGTTVKSHYDTYGEYGIRQVLGIGNPYDKSLIYILEKIKEDI